MKVLKIISVFTLVIVVSASCKKKSDAEDYASVVCDCAKPMVDLRNKMMKNDSADMAQIMTEYQDAGKKVEDCIGTRLDKYKGKDSTDAEFQKEVMEQLKTQCPDVYNAFYGDEPEMGSSDTSAAGY